MFVVWRSRERKFWHRVRHTARLVESTRINGKPRQLLIAVLGSYEELTEPNGEPDPDHARRQRLRFWRSARAVLEARDISREERTRIEAHLAERIAPPTKADIHRQWEEYRITLVMVVEAGLGGPDAIEALQAHLANEPEKPAEGEL